MSELRAGQGYDNGAESVDLIGFCQMLWRRKLIIVSAAVIFGSIAAAAALLATPIFKAEIVITEVHDSSMSAAASLSSQFGGLASLAGINLGQSNDTQQAQAVLASRYLAEEFVERNKLVPVLFRKKTSKPPTLWRAVERFKEQVVRVNKDARKGVTAVSIEWIDPNVAAHWANEYVALANELLRKKALDESTRNIAYLNTQLEKTNTVELRKVIYNIIESETKTLMLASGRSEYAFTIVDPAVVPEERASPRRTLMVIVGTALGGFVGILAAFILETLAGRERPGSQKR